MKPHTATYKSPLGTIVIESDGKVLTGLRFADNLCERPDVADRVAYNNADASSKNVFAEVRQWLDDYFAGRQPRYVPRMNPPGTDFQRRVWQRLFTIGYGQTRTYGEIARMVGCLSARAVGQAIGRNPIALIIPCHRVIGSDGSITGYAYGIDRKKRLLELEKKL